MTVQTAQRLNDALFTASREITHEAFGEQRGGFSLVVRDIIYEHLGPIIRELADEVQPSKTKPIVAQPPLT